MSYIAARRDNEDIIVWIRDESGRYPKRAKAEFYYYIEDPKGEYNSLYGHKLTKKTFTTNKELFEARTIAKFNGDRVFESDIPAELKHLSKHYYNVKAPKLHVALLDIEVDYDPAIGFSSVENPYAPINSIAIYTNWENKMLVIAVPPPDYLGDPQGLTQELIIKYMHEETPLPTDCEVVVELLTSEEELIL